MLNQKKQHRKYWRPSILLISNEVDPLIEFCANLKKGGLFVLGTVIKGNFTDMNPTAQRVKKAWQKIILQVRRLLASWPAGWLAGWYCAGIVLVLCCLVGGVYLCDCLHACLQRQLVLLAPLSFVVVPAVRTNDCSTARVG